LTISVGVAINEVVKPANIPAAKPEIIVLLHAGIENSL
jgi:hypothetical protein